VAVDAPGGGGSFGRGSTGRTSFGRGPIGRLSDRLPLRVRLVAAVLALVALALAVAGVAGAAALREYLVGRVDDQLRTAAPDIAGRVGHGMPGGRGGRPGRSPLQPATDFYVRLSSGGGEELDSIVAGDVPPPRLDGVDLAATGQRPFTVAAVAGSTQWRAVVHALPGEATVTLAFPLDEVQAAVRQLVAVNALVAGAVLVALAGLAYLAVRSSLRPLAEVEATAAAIAAGDLSRRVPERHPATEVGRLGRALNVMLGQIQAAFRAREESETAARASEDRMRRFVADASHELRTPLTSIRGFAELYRQGGAPEPADVARVLRRIEDEAARMGLLVEDLLLLARLDQQRPLRREPVDLLAVARDAVEDARALAPGRPVDLRVTGEAAPVVTGDEHRLRQVAANLVSNALTHTPPETPVTVTVGTVRAPEAAFLEVRDRGPGMAPEDAARVFERFYRADASRTRSAGGSGLGMAIVAALVAAHGGRVDLDSAPGQGTTIRVLLPRG
jgi:signal transduction histidine kinase